MFLLNNAHDRAYATIYPELKNVVFDISDAQLSNARNKDWHAIANGSIVCVVNGTRMVSTFYRIEENLKTDVVDENGHQHVIRGTVVAKLNKDEKMQRFLEQAGVKHSSLPRNNFCVGTHIANLGDALDSLVLRTKKGSASLGELKQPKA